MERERATPSLHQLVDAALERGARAQDESRILIDDSVRLGRALRATLGVIEARHRDAARLRSSETDS